jgi:hypothetical protein
MMIYRAAIRAGLLLFLLVNFASAEATIKHFFPQTPALLGEPLFWLIELRYPLWESYEIHVKDCRGAKLQVADQNLFADADEMVARYRVRITPDSLSVTDIPTVLITSQNGQSVVLTGKPVNVSSISGNSTELKIPGGLTMMPPQRKSVQPYILVAICVVLFGTLLWRRRRNKDPRYLLVKDLKRAVVEVRRGRLPQQVWRLLRSDLLWGFPADVYTPAQLKEKSLDGSKLMRIAQTLQSLEVWRYSGESSGWQATDVERSLVTALEMVQTRRTAR